MKFKVGQKVRVKENLVVGRMYGEYQFTAAMAKYRGKTYSIFDVVCDHYQLSGCMNMDGNFYWYFTDEMLELAEFTEDDLKTGMVVEYRNGSRRVVFEDRLLGHKAYCRLNQFEETLLIIGSCHDLDIMKVYRPNMKCVYELEDIFDDTNLNLIWERQEESEPEAEEMTLAEIEKELGRKIKIVSEES